MKPKAVALCRVSTIGQVVDGHSLEDQALNIENAEIQLGCEVIKVWSISKSRRKGKEIKKSDLEEIRQFCKQHSGIKYLLIDKVNRFMREVEIFYWYIVEFKMMGIKVWFCSPDQQDLNGEDQLATLKRFLAAYEAEADNRERAQTTKAKMKSRVATGYRPFPPTQGYVKSGTPGLHEPDPIRFPLLQDTFREVLSRQYMPAEAERRLYQRGYLTLSGKRLGVKGLMKLLRNPYYAGIIHVNGWENENLRGLHKAMITIDEYYELQAILSNKKLKYQRKTHNPEFPLSNQVYCLCKGRFVGYNHNNGKGNTYARYRCRSCGKNYLRKDIHESLSTHLSQIKIDADNKQELINALEKVWRREQASNIQYLKQLELRIVTLKEQKNRLVLSLSSNPDLADDITDSIKRVKDEIAQVENDYKNAQAVEEEFVEFSEFALNFVDGLKDQWWQLDFEARKMCKQLLFFDEIFVDANKKVYTPKISPLFRFESTKKDPVCSPESLLVARRGIEPLLPP